MKTYCVFENVASGTAWISEKESWENKYSDDIDHMATFVAEFRNLVQAKRKLKQMRRDSEYFVALIDDNGIPVDYIKMDCCSGTIHAVEYETGLKAEQEFKTEREVRDYLGIL